MGARSAPGVTLASAVGMKKILVALDGSPRAPDVLTAAHDLAQRTDARLVLLRAVSLPTDLPVEAYIQSPIEVLRKHAEEYLAECAKILPREIIARQHVVVGQPWQAICSAAIEDDADLIVIGSHGYGIIDRVLGTTAAKVVNHADRSVFVVRALDRLVKS